MNGALSLDAVLRATGYVLPDRGDVTGLRRSDQTLHRGGEPDVIWRDRTGIAVHFKYTAGSARSSEVFESRRHAWNTGTAALLWVVSPYRIDVYDAYGRPKASESEEDYLLRTFGAVEQELAHLDAYAGRLAMESGRFWAAEKRIRTNERVDTQLLADLAQLEQRLTDRGLQRRYAQALIGRTVFLSYLRDRGIATIQQHQAFGEGGLQTCFRDKDQVYELFDWLRRTFNGDLFPVESGELQEVETWHTSMVADVFAGVDPVIGQGSLWPYRFDVIPVEFISSIYEQFVHSSDTAEARQAGVHYTPVSVANLVLDEVLTDVDSKSRILDLTCGSGIFLVEALRRLAWKRSGLAAPTRELIRDTLHSQIFGVDCSDGAVRVAAFSLYLAALDLDPEPAPPQALRFKPLIGRSLFVADALRELPPPIAAGGFDVVLGNPPWTYSGLGSQPDFDWLRNRPLPPRSADFPFVWRLLSLGREGARLGVVMRATPFFSRAAKSRKACSALLHAAAPVSIVDLSSLRDELFPTADYPALIVLGRLPQQPDREIVPVIKVPWTPAFSRSRSFDVSPDDIRMLPLAAFSADYPSLKMVAFGSNRDRMMLRRFSKDNPTLRDTLGEWGTLLATGAQLLSGDGNDATDLLGLPLLKAGRLKPFIDADALPAFDLPKVHRPRSREIYRAPLVLIGEGARGGRLSIGFSARDLVYTESFYGISLANTPQERTMCLAGVLASNIPAWHILLTASEFGVHKRKLLLQDLLQLPVPTPAQFASAAARAVAVAFGSICQSDNRSSRRALDEAVSDLFGLSAQERIVIEDGATRAAREYIEQRDIAERPPSRADLHAYARAFLGVINPWRRLDGRSEFAAEVFIGAGDSPLSVIRFLPALAEYISESRFNASLNETISSIGRRLHVPLRESLRVSRQLRVYSSEEVFVIKPSALRYWSPGSGLTDADKCLGDALEVSGAPDGELSSLSGPLPLWA